MQDTITMIGDSIHQWLEKTYDYELKRVLQDAGFRQLPLFDGSSLSINYMDQISIEFLYYDNHVMIVPPPPTSEFKELLYSDPNFFNALKHHISEIEEQSAIIIS